ncbi:putative metal-binding membrane protein [Sphingomonas sp. UYAg733]
MIGQAARRWRHWPLVAPSLFAWALLLSWSIIPILPDLCGPGGHFWTTVPASFAIALRINALPPLFLSWLVMLCAMMLPLLHTPLAQVRAGSGARRRDAAVAAFLIAYVAVWIAAIVVLVALASLLRLTTASSVLAGPLIALGVAAAWQAMPIKQRCLYRCGVAPMPRSGFVHELNAARHGVMVGAACVGSCWALMALPFFFTGAPHILVMAAVALIMLYERYGRPEAHRAAGQG